MFFRKCKLSRNYETNYVHRFSLKFEQYHISEHLEVYSYVIPSNILCHFGQGVILPKCGPSIYRAVRIWSMNHGHNYDQGQPLFLDFFCGIAIQTKAMRKCCSHRNKIISFIFRSFKVGHRKTLSYSLPSYHVEMKTTSNFVYFCLK